MVVDGDQGFRESGSQNHELLGPRTWLVVAVAATAWATVNPVADFLRNYDYGGLSLHERLDLLGPVLWPTAAFGYLLAALAGVAAYQGARRAFARRLLGLIALCSALVGVFGLYTVWHYLTIKVHGLNDTNTSLGFTLSHSAWGERVASMMWGAAAAGLSAVTIWITFAVATARAEIDAESVGDEDDPEPVELTPMQ